MGIENLLAQGVQIRPAGMERNALMQAQEFKDRQQKNALMQMQMDDVHAQRQLAIQQAQQVAADRARSEQFRQSIPSPQMQASQQALAGGGGPTVGNAAQMRPVDPRLQMLHGAMQAGMGTPLDYINAANPAPMKLGKDDRLLQPGPGGSFRELVGATPAKPEKGTSDQQNYAGVVAQGYKGTFEQFLREQANLKAPKTSVHIGAPEREFDKELAKLDAKQLDGYRDQADKATGAVSRVRAMRSAVESGVYSGSFAGDRTKVANFFATLGAPGVDLGKLANSQEYQKHAKELTLSVLKDGVGSGNISNADLAFVNETVPQLETSPEARIRLLSYIEKRSQGQIDNFRQADAYARKNRGLGGYSGASTPNPSQPGVNPPAPANKPSVSNW